jgi:hypothetical protein
MQTRFQYAEYRQVYILHMLHIYTLPTLLMPKRRKNAKGCGAQNRPRRLQVRHGFLQHLWGAYVGGGCVCGTFHPGLDSEGTWTLTPKYRYAEKYENIYVIPFGICRIVTGLYSAYLSYICTPHFADCDGSSPYCRPPGLRQAGGAAAADVRCGGCSSTTQTRIADTLRTGPPDQPSCYAQAPWHQHLATPTLGGPRHYAPGRLDSTRRIWKRDHYAVFLIFKILYIFK